MNWPASRCALAALLLAAALPLRAQTLPAEDRAVERATLPKWEGGVMFAGLMLPQYPAAEDYRYLAVPVPYFVYRGDVLRAEDGSSRVRQKLAEHVEIDVSGGGALSSNGNSDAREGMPDLDYLVELGPNLKLNFDGPRPQSKVLINLPLRAVISVGSGVDWQGFIFEPELAYLSERFVGGRLLLRASISSEFTGTLLQRYFYEVAPRYATAERPAYRADGGYMGSSIGLRAAYAFSPRWRGFISTRYFRHSGAANEDSPLFRNVHGYSVAIGLAWAFMVSKEMAVAE